MIYNTQSLVSSETRWIRQREDLAAIGHGAEHGWFNAFVEDLLTKVSARLLLVSSVAKSIDGCISMLPLQLKRSYHWFYLRYLLSVCSPAEFALILRTPIFQRWSASSVSSTCLEYMSDYS